MAHNLTFGSLFAGIGGFDLGLERAGLVCKWQVEIDEFKRGVLAHWWPDVERFADITTVVEGDLAAVDVVTAGFPCQDNASCGRRAGLAGDKSGLWATVPAILRWTRPRFVLVENPPGVLKRGIDRILADLAEFGFDAEWAVLPAAAFGAPQLRARIWILAYARGDRVEAHDTVFAGRAKPDVCAWWATEPALDRVADGFPGRLVGSLGDAVVPQIAEWLGRRLIEADCGAAPRRGGVMPKFRKKPVVIEASQWFKNGDHPDDGDAVFPERETPGMPSTFSPGYARKY